MKDFCTYDARVLEYSSLEYREKTVTIVVRKTEDKYVGILDHMIKDVYRYVFKLVSRDINN